MTTLAVLLIIYLLFFSKDDGCGCFLWLLAIVLLLSAN